MSDYKTYEMQWDCQFCGTTKLLGKTHRFCPNCGAAQNPDSRYYPSDEEKVAVEDHVFVGEDRICPACDTLNSGEAEFCMQCGAPLTDAARARKLAEQSRAEGASFASSGSRDLAQERFDAEMQRIGVQPKPGERPKRSPLLLYGIIALVVLVVGGVLLSIFWRQEQTIAVTGHTWQREIAIDSYEARSDSAWCDSMPGDAYSITRRTEQRSTNRVPDGQDCRTVRRDNGDGTFSERQECTTRYREEPVYDQRCYFTVNRWGYERSVRAEGTGLDDAPRWPAANLRGTGQCLGCEREGGRTERYRVLFEEGYSCDLAEAQWRSMPVNSRWRVPIGVISNQPDCSAIQPAG